MIDVAALRTSHRVPYRPSRFSASVFSANPHLPLCLATYHSYATMCQKWHHDCVCSTCHREYFVSIEWYHDDLTRSECKGFRDCGAVYCKPSLRAVCGTCPSCKHSSTCKACRKKSHANRFCAQFIAQRKFAGIKHFNEVDR